MGEPVPEGAIAVRENEWEYAKTSRIHPWSAEGKFDFEFPASGNSESLWLLASALGYARVRQEVPIGGDRTAVEVEVPLAGTQTVVGRIVDPRGRPLPSLLVCVGPTAARAWWKAPLAWPGAALAAEEGEGWTRTDERGEFRFRGPAPARGICAVAEDGWLLEEGPVPVDPKKTPTWHAAPAFAVDVRAEADDKTDPGSVTARFALRTQEGAGETTVFALRSETGEGGAFTGRWILTAKSFPPHGRIDVDVRLRAQGLAPWTTTRTLVWGERRVDVSAVLHHHGPDEMGRVQVLLLEPALSRLEGESIAVSRRPEGDPEGEWEEVGEFAIPQKRAERDAGVDPDRAAPPFERAPSEWEAPAGDVFLNVEVLGTRGLCAWTGRVVVPPGKTGLAKVSFAPLGSLTVRARADAPKIEQIAFEESGNDGSARRSPWIRIEPGDDLEIPHVPAGAYRLLFRSRPADARTIVVEPGPPTVVDLGAPK